MCIVKMTHILDTLHGLLLVIEHTTFQTLALFPPLDNL